jgi:hypothetical protein
LGFGPLFPIAIPCWIAYEAHIFNTNCIVFHDRIKEKAEKLGAIFDLEIEAGASSDYSLLEQNMIRENHHYLSAAWISFAYSNNDPAKETPLDNAIKLNSGNLIQDLMDICMYHSKLQINNCEVESKQKNGRKRLIATILRFADELDIDINRIADDAYDAFRVPSYNKLYWWLHEHTTIHFNEDTNSISIIISLHPDDRKMYGSVIKSFIVEKFKTKNQALLNILVQNGFLISIDNESDVIEDEYVDKMPQEVAQLIIENAVKQRDSAYILKVGERFAGIGLYKLSLRGSQWGDYLLLDIGNKNIYLPYNHKIYSILTKYLQMKRRERLLIKRNDTGYAIFIGPRIMEVGEEINDWYHDATLIKEENVFLVLIGNHEIKLPVEAGRELIATFMRGYDIISILRNEDNYIIRPVRKLK